MGLNSSDLARLGPRAQKQIMEKLREKNRLDPSQSAAQPAPPKEEPKGRLWRRDEGIEAIHAPKGCGNAAAPRLPRTNERMVEMELLDILRILAVVFACASLICNLSVLMIILWG